ncbi:MAG: hypothetical protein WKF43_06230 [Acidimicrobiales bacterium]
MATTSVSGRYQPLVGDLDDGRWSRPTIDPLSVMPTAMVETR